MVLQFLVILVLLCFLLSLTNISGYTPVDVKSWCSQTPYPHPCEYFLSLKYGRINQKADFFKVSLQLALDRANHAQGNAYTLGPKCRSERERAAWIDCLELYEYTIQKIHKTIDPSTKCTEVDAQTWLSTALTNLETCQTGFIELGVPDYVLPLMSNNVSKLISNTLAMNKKVTYGEPSYKKGFPTWVSGRDRRLLQAPSPATQASIVVARDGSGDFKTVNEAIATTEKRSGNGRFVIYIKAGVCKEIVEIGITLTNIMLVGDGIGKTIITGSNSVGGGTTTFRSATVGM